MVKYICPECGSPKVNQYRMPFGPMWCTECDYRVEAKESDDTFEWVEEDEVQCSINEVQCVHCEKWHLVADEKLKRQITKQMIGKEYREFLIHHNGSIPDRQELEIRLIEHWLEEENKNETD